MKYKERIIELKDTRKVKIREAVETDAAALLDTVKTYIADSEYIPKLEHEIGITIEEEKKWINRFRESHNSILLIAEYEGEIIGNADLTGSSREIMQHTGVIGMGMLQEWRNKGLGTALLRSVIEWASANPILEIVWLQVYSENKAGRALYEKVGFREAGLIKNYFRHGHQYFDNITMTLELK